MRGTSDLGARTAPGALRARRLRRGGEGVRIEVVVNDTGANDRHANATLMPEASRIPLSGAFLRAAIEMAWDMAERRPMTVTSPALTPGEARSFAEAGFVTTSELHLLTHDLSTAGRTPTSSPAPGEVPLRRGTNGDLAEALRVDGEAFASGWVMTAHGFANAKAATPVTRLRVADARDQDPSRLVGYALTGRAGRRGYLQRLAVDPACHRRGVGSALVVDAIRWCRRRGVQRLVVNTQVGNDGALRLYRGLGFVESSTRLWTMEYRTATPDA